MASKFLQQAQTSNQTRLKPGTLIKIIASVQKNCSLDGAGVSFNAIKN